MPSQPLSTQLPRAELADDIARAAAQLATSPDFPTSRIARIRAAGARLSAGEFRPDNLRHAAVLLERQANVDLDVPTASRLPGVGIVKRVLKRLMLWYLRFLGHQITAFGQATARLGVAVANRVDRLDADVADLQDRVARLEDELADRSPSEGARG